MITWENYEEYMMLHADGELKPAEEQELMSFVYEHPELANELAAFSMSKMIPDTAMVYTNKKALLKKEPVKVIAFPNWQRYAVAAGVAALLFVAGVRFFTSQPAHITNSYVQNDKKNKDEAAVVAVNDGSFTTQPAHTANSSVQDDKMGVVPTHEADGPVQDDKEKSIAAIVSPQHTTTLPATKTTRVKQASAKPKNIRVKPETRSAVAQVKDDIERVPAEYIALAEINYSEIFSPGAVTNMPPATIQIEEGQSKSFLDKLPIDDLKKNGMKHVATAMASGYDKVNAIRQEINDASISVRVEKRKLILSF